MAVNENLFPNLTQTGYTITSPANPRYNCIAWAAGQTDSWWWPDVDQFDFWPADLPCEETLECFQQAFIGLGYEPCASYDLEAGFEKVVLYALNGLPTHAARQLPNGRWTSKLGPEEDIEHSLEGVNGPCYGFPALVLRRPISPQRVVK